MRSPHGKLGSPAQTLIIRKKLEAISISRVMHSTIFKKLRMCYFEINLLKGKLFAVLVSILSLWQTAWGRIYLGVRFRGFSLWFVGDIVSGLWWSRGSRFKGVGGRASGLHDYREMGQRKVQSKLPQGQVPTDSLLLSRLHLHRIPSPPNNSIKLWIHQWV